MGGGVTPTEAALRLDVSYDWVLRLLRLKQIKGRRNQKGWHVDEQSVSEYLNGRAERRARKNGKEK